MEQQSSETFTFRVTYSRMAGDFGWLRLTTDPKYRNKEFDPEAIYLTVERAHSSARVIVTARGRNILQSGDLGKLEQKRSWSAGHRYGGNTLPDMPTWVRDIVYADLEAALETDVLQVPSGIALLAPLLAADTDGWLK